MEAKMGVMNIRSAATTEIGSMDIRLAWSRQVGIVYLLRLIRSTHLIAHVRNSSSQSVNLQSIAQKYI
jgi:hypothetical protein